MSIDITIPKKKKEALVVCEHRISGRCNHKGCPAFNQNKIDAPSCKELENGQLYYNYSCGNNNEIENTAVKLLDINFYRSAKKVNPNFAFMCKKGTLPF